MSSSPVALVPATSADADEVAQLLDDARATFLPYAPSPHAPAARRAWVRDVLLPGGGVTLARRGGRLCGVLAVSQADGVAWIDQLYVAPGQTGRGVGLALLRQALDSLPAPVRLHTFQANDGARRFYARAGFREIALGDGTGNEERCPDVLMERPAGAEFRRRFMRAQLRPALDGVVIEPIEPGLRPPAETDLPALGVLMYMAYHGTLDDEGGSPADALAEVRRWWEGAYGPCRPEVSRVAWRDGQPLAAALVTQFEGRPFIAFSLAHPAIQGQGLARATLRSAMAALRHLGETELRLVVTLSNTPARRLYLSCGFQEAAADDPPGVDAGQAASSTTSGLAD